MPAPSPLAIATQSVQRLVKEQKYYEKELASQTERVQKLEADQEQKSKAQTNGNSTTTTTTADGNAEYVIKQEKQAMEETKAVFAPLKTRIEEAVQRLEEQIATAEENAPTDEMTKANEALSLSKGVEAA
ncbi:Uu.00g040560.m01.CDS01 [Anthostomella pinea]|uniref:Tubulin-specific chaperone A n=1 Tax=Anthostomella pinea TaxID=933095 RepID=A0AAI8V595_9PEZI|nr:Uu.00g040560.m01.CDS01 [Anthostomella pinea]